MLASPWAATVEGLAAAVALRASGRPGLPAALAAPSALMVGNALKRLIARPRPGLARFARKGRESFPSTHVAGPLAVLACVYLMLNLPSATWLRFFIWMAIGLVVYFAYGARHSRLVTDPHYSREADAAAADKRASDNRASDG